MGYHHAGMDISDRKAIETLFTSGDLPVLCKYLGISPVTIHLLIFSVVSTSTLAMGVSHATSNCVCVYTCDVLVQVNLPAHLVVVKSTSHYVQGMFQEYSESQVLQMIGRAGRPQVPTVTLYWYILLRGLYT